MIDDREGEAASVKGVQRLSLSTGACSMGKSILVYDNNALEAAQVLYITCGIGIVTANWFNPRQGTWGADGRLNPSPLIVSPDHVANAEALLAVHA